METFLIVAFYLIGIYVATLPVLVPIIKKTRGARPKTFSKRLKYITPLGWTFIFAVGALIVISIIRDVYDKNQSDKQIEDQVIIEKALQAKLDSSYQKQVYDALIRQIESKNQQDTLTAINLGLVKRDIEQFKYMTTLQQNLNKWGLVIRDSMIVKRHGVPVLKTKSFQIDSNFTVEFSIDNFGTGEALEVESYFLIMEKSSTNPGKLVPLSSEYICKMDLAINESYIFRIPLDPSNRLIKSYEFYIVGDFSAVQNGVKKPFLLGWRWEVNRNKWYQLPRSDSQEFLLIAKDLSTWIKESKIKK